VRAQGPLVAGALGSVTASHAVVGEIVRHEDLRMDGDEQALPAPLGRLLRWARDRSTFGPLDPPSLLAVEPPDHTRYRRLVSRVFTARAVEALRPRVQAVADELLDDLSGRPETDLVEAYASRLPITVISELLSVPPQDRERVRAYGRRGAPSLDMALSWPQYRDTDDSVRGFSAWLDGHLARLRREPDDGLLSQLVQLEEDGQGLDHSELRAVAGLLLVAGFETTVNLLGSGAALLLEHPEQLARLRAEPALWPDAVEELLRYESPVQLTARLVAEDTELAGQVLRRGSLVVALIGGANRDPEVFDDPAQLDVTRANARDHLSFSGGRHYCLGAALARLEGEVGLRALFDRFPDLSLLPGRRRTTTQVLRGWDALPVSTGVPAAARR
jgi:cytochrome P450